MNDSIKRISLDLHDTNSRETVKIKRSDTGRKIYISLVDGGMPYRISEDCFAVLTGKKPDGHIIFNNCTIEGNVICYKLTAQTSAVPGLVPCEIKLYGADAELITSSKFSIMVEDTVYDEGDEIESTSEFNALAALVDKIAFWEGLTDEQVAEAVAAYMAENPVELAGVVKTINGNAPDEDGNVTVKSAHQLAQEAGYMGTEEELGVQLATSFIDWFGVGISIPSGADLNTYKTKGKYYASTESIGKSLLNRPSGMNTNFVMWVFNRTSSSIYSQLMLTLPGKMYIRSANSSGWRDWVAYTTSGEIAELTDAVRLELEGELAGFCGRKVQDGLTVAIIGDSISTFYGENAHEVEIVAEDVGVELSSYITHYDIGKTVSKDGVTSDYTITSDDVGNEVKFIPCGDDVGKKLGEPKNYNTTAKTEKTWWQVAADRLGFEPIAASWSGSSITSHESSDSTLRCSHAWHDHTIRKLGKRVPGSMNRIAPDVVLIYRGTNDLSHSTKVRLTKGFFDAANWNYPSTDVLSGGTTFGYKEGLALTIQKIRTTYPRARIVLCTCNVFKRSNYSHFPTHNGYFSIPQMNNAIREVADFFGCPVIELDKCGITWENCYNEGYITDSSAKPTHPNTSGHALMGQQAICDLVNRVHIADIDPSHDVITFIPDETVAPETPVVPEDKENLIDKGVFVDSNYVDKGSGSLIASTSYFTYTDIPVEGNEKYDVPYVRNYAFYGADGAYITSGGKSGAVDAVVTAPENAVTLAVCYRHADRTPDNVTVTKQASTEPEVPDVPEDNNDNLVSLGTLVEGEYVTSNSGIMTAGAAYFSYTHIPVEGGATYNAPYGRNYAFYGADGSRVSGGAAGGSASAVLTAHSNAATLTVCYKYVDLEPGDVIITKA